MPIVKNQKTRKMENERKRRQEKIKKVGSKGHSLLKSAGKAALKATPIGMGVTAGKALKKEFNRLTKKKKKTVKKKK